MPRITLAHPTFRRSVAVGSLAATAYLVEQEIDRRLISNSYDDLVLWGGFLSHDFRVQQSLGLLAHYTLGISLAALYGALLPSMPKGPGWLRGLVFTQVENALLYPGVPLLNRVNGAVRRGQIPSLLTWRYFWVEVARHAAYGLVLGALMPERPKD